MKTVHCKLGRGVLLGLSIALSIAVHADESQTSDATADLAQTTCADLAEAPEMDRAFSLIFYYGYLAGRAGATVIDSSAVPGHLEKVRDYCNENAEATVIAAFEQALGNQQ